IVCLPHNQYMDVITILAESKKHIIKEKPLATSVQEAKRMLRTVQENNVYLGIFCQRRFYPVYTGLNQVVRAGVIGETRSIELTYINENTCSVWRLKRSAGGGSLMDTGYHMIDLLIWNFGLPKTVFMRKSRGFPSDSEVESDAYVVFEYKSSSESEPQTVGNIIASRTGLQKRESLRVVGMDGIVEIYQLPSREKEELIFEMDTSTKDEQFKTEYKFDRSTVAISQLEYFAEQVNQFICGQHTSPNATQHLAHVAFVEASYTSAATGMPCQVSDFLEAEKVRWSRDE
ncbi:MAG: Gfo/Idh/MocA family oxidoreductase, partial [Candidatus Methanomethylicaceae archaeon]